MPAIICKANRSNGEPCGGFAMRGQLVCYVHGGAAPQAKAAAERRLGEEKLSRLERRTLKSLNDVMPFDSITDVYSELLHVAAVSAQWRKILQKRITKLEKLGYAGVTAEQVRADVQLFERSIDRSAKVSEAIARLNLEERRQALDEKTAGLLLRGVQKILGDLDLTDEQQRRAATAVPRRLRELSA